jgi:thiamine kinase
MAADTTDSRGPLIGRGRTAEIYAWGDGDGYALKLYYERWSPAVVQDEADRSRLVAAIGVPAPAIERVLELDGRWGMVMERLDGRSLLQGVGERPWTLAATVCSFADLHAAMHTADLGEVDVSDHDLGQPPARTHTTLPTLPALRERLVERIGQASAASERARSSALRRLDVLPEGRALCHGDYHPDNVLVTRHGPIIIDWGNASRGHPLADVAQTELLVQLGEPPGTPSAVERALLATARSYVHRAYLSRYLRQVKRQPERKKYRLELAAWHLPVAVARLADEIPNERGGLLRRIERELAMAEECEE